MQLQIMNHAQFETVDIRIVSVSGLDKKHYFVSDKRIQRGRRKILSACPSLHFYLSHLYLALALASAFANIFNVVLNTQNGINIAHP